MYFYIIILDIRKLHVQCVALYACSSVFVCVFVYVLCVSMHACECACVVHVYNNHVCVCELCVV